MGTDSAHEEGVGRIPPQGGPQADGEATVERTGRRLGLPPVGGGYGGGGRAGSGDLCLPSPEHSCTLYCDQANCGTVSGGKTEAGTKGGNEMVGPGRFGFGGNADGVPGGGTYLGRGGDGRDVYSNRQHIKR